MYHVADMTTRMSFRLLAGLVALGVLAAGPLAAQGASRASARPAPAARSMVDVPPPRLNFGLRLPSRVMAKEEMVLEVVDDLNRPVAGARVSVKPDEGCGSVDLDSARTDAAGRLRATWQLGTRAGICSAVARVVGSERFPRVITVAVGNGPVGKIQIVRGGDQRARFGTILPENIQVQVLDKYGNIARNARVRFTVVRGGGRLVDYGAVPALTRSSNIKGLAGVAWRLGPAGPQAIEVRAIGVPDAPPLLITAVGVP